MIHTLSWSWKTLTTFGRMSSAHMVRSLQQARWNCFSAIRLHMSELVMLGHLFQVLWCLRRTRAVTLSMSVALGCEYYQVSSNPHYLTTLDHRVSEVIFDYENWRILFYAQSIRLSDAGRSVKFSGTKSGVSGVWGSRSSNSHFARDEDTPVFALGYSQDLGDRFPLF